MEEPLTTFALWLRLCTGIGLIALILGHFGASLFMKIMRRYLNFEREKLSHTGVRPVPAWFMGMFERLIFSVVIAQGGSLGPVSASMFGWLGLKLATNWKLRPSNKGDVRRVVTGSQLALLGGVVSLVFATWGGFVVRDGIFPSSQVQLLIENIGTRFS